MTHTIESTLAHLDAVRALIEEQAMKNLGVEPPLSADQWATLSRTSNYQAARRMLCRAHRLEYSDYSELTFLVIGGHETLLAQLVARPLKRDGGTQLRALASPKACAKAVREHARGSAIRVKASKTEIDQAQAELVAALRKFRQAGGTSDRAVAAVLASGTEDLGWLHAFMQKLAGAVLVVVNDELAKRNVQPWAWGLAFLKGKKTWQLLRLPAPVG
jgi:hypothetical protein